MEFVPGPDFPTGATILGRNGIRAAYELGRGSLVMRARTRVEENRAGRESIIISEIPYQENKARLHERIAEVVRDKKVEGVAEIRDESDKDGVRLVIELKREAMADIVAMMLACDMTRVFSYWFTQPVNNLLFPSATSGHHQLTHDEPVDPKLGYQPKATKFVEDIMAQWAVFLKVMDSMPEGDVTLLDHSMIVYGSGLSDGNRHLHESLPILLAGKMGGKFKTGYRHDYKLDTPMANLLVTILDKAGLPIEKLGDSTGPLKLDPLNVG